MERFKWIKAIEGVPSSTPWNAYGVVNIIVDYVGPPFWEHCRRGYISTDATTAWPYIERHLPPYRFARVKNREVPQHVDGQPVIGVVFRQSPHGAKEGALFVRVASRRDKGKLIPVDDVFGWSVPNRATPLCPGCDGCSLTDVH